MVTIETWQVVANNSGIKNPLVADFPITRLRKQRDFFN